MGTIATTKNRMEPQQEYKGNKCQKDFWCQHIIGQESVQTEPQTGEYLKRKEDFLKPPHVLAHRQAETAAFYSRKGFFPPLQIGTNCYAGIDQHHSEKGVAEECIAVCNDCQGLFYKGRNIENDIQQEQDTQHHMDGQPRAFHGFVGGFQPQSFICFQRDGVFCGGVENQHVVPVCYIMPASLFTVSDVFLLFFRGIGSVNLIGRVKGCAVGAFFRRDFLVCPKGVGHVLQNPAFLRHIFQMGGDAFCIIKNEVFQSLFAFHVKALLYSGGNPPSAASDVDIPFPAYLIPFG